MGLFRRNTTTVGLDIGSGLIKLVVISHARAAPVLTKVAFATVVDDAIVEGEVMDPGHRRRRDQGPAWPRPASRPSRSSPPSAAAT